MSHTSPIVLLWVSALACVPEAPSSPRPGVIVVSIDTMRADYGTPWGAPAGATPNLSRLAEESVVFERAYSQANETLFAHGALFSSRLPSHVAPLDYDWTLPDAVPTLAEAFSAGGWRTAAVVASGHLARVFGVDDGFAEYAEGERFGSFQQTMPMALRWLDQHQRAPEPFFLFVHGYDCHTPYPKPGMFRRLGTPEYRGQLLSALFLPNFYEQLYGTTWYPEFPVGLVRTPGGRDVLDPTAYARLPGWAATHEGIPLSAEDVAWLRTSYGTAVLYADLWLGWFLTELERRGLDQTTTLVVMSDHGEGLLDHGFNNHRQTLHDESTHVPLMIRAPGVAPGRVTEVVSLIDVAPTLLDLQGLPPLEGAEGRSLRPCLTGTGVCGAEWSVSEGSQQMVSVTNGAQRLIVEGLAAESTALDAAIRAQDPAITESWAGEPSPEVQAQLRAGLLAVRGVH